MGQPRAVLGFQRARKPSLVRLKRRHFPTADHMHPERELRTCEVAPEDIQPLVPAIERLIIGALKARTSQPKDLYVVPECGADNVGADVRGVGNTFGRRKLAPECRLPGACAHDRDTAALLTEIQCGEVRRRPLTPGGSSESGE